MKIRQISLLQTKSFTVVCFYVGVLCLSFQLIAFLILLHSSDNKGIINSNFVSLSKTCYDFLEKDLEKLSELSQNSGFSFILLDKQLLIKPDILQNVNNKLECSHCDYCKPAILGLDHGTLTEKRKQLFSKMVDENFAVVTFYNIQPSQSVSMMDSVKTAMFLTRRAKIQIVFLHPREDNTWWFGNLMSDVSWKSKLAFLNLTWQHIELMTSEGAIDRFEVIPGQLNENISLMVPKDTNTFLSDIDHSKFIECNMTRAILFRSMFKPDYSAEAIRFRHKAWKMLSRVKTVLDSLKIPFWLSSGTVLGYYRDCDVIPHSKDVDIGVWASSYTNKIITEMHKRGFRLKISLGFPYDSLELSFLDESGIKLDIFFFYQEKDHYWNGGTQVKSGKKFKYDFPKFTLCWTLFKDLRVRVPCETEDYIRANYGPDWFIPVKNWDWKTSPFNVKPNGVWRTDQLADAIKLYAT